MKTPLAQLIVVSILAVFVILGYGYWYAQVDSRSVAVSELEAQIAMKTENEKNLAATRASLAELASDEATIHNYFVSNDGVVAFIDSLESLGKTVGAVVNVTSVATAGSKTQPALQLALGIDGSFDTVMRTAGAIEYAPYDIVVTALSLQSTDKNKWHADMSMLVGSASSTAASTKP